MSLLVVQMLGVVLTFGASGLTFVNARSANKSQQDVAHRTTSLSEMEAALTFTGSQLKELRAEVTEQSAQIRQLRTLHEECEADKFQLYMQLAELRGHL